MTPTQVFNEDQRTRWNGIDGEYWTSNQDRMDRTLAPVTGPLLAFAAPRAGSTVIDVGCGCRATTIELARAVGPSRARCWNRCLEADARARGGTLARVRQHDLSRQRRRRAAAERSESRTDRFAFRSDVLRRSRGGVREPADRLGCRWAPALRLLINENPGLQIPLHAVHEHAPRLPKPDPEEPGPFAFGDTARVTRILKAAGFTEPSFTPLDIQMDTAAGGTLEDAVIQSSAMGPAKRALADQPDDIRAAAIESIRRALAPYVSPAGVKLAGAVWLVAADQPA
jgi:hypothetical protein